MVSGQVGGVKSSRVVMVVGGQAKGKYGRGGARKVRIGKRLFEEVVTRLGGVEGGNGGRK